LAAFLPQSSQLNFSTTIQTSIGKRTFLFTRLHFSGKKVYHVQVFGRFVNSYFGMIHKEGGWQFEKPQTVNDWIVEVKAALQSALDDYHKE